MDKERKEKEKRKREKKKKKGEQTRKEREEELDRERERKERETKIRDFPGIPKVEPNGPRVKVNPRIAGCVWVPISWSFVKLREVGNFPTWNICSLKAM